MARENGWRRLLAGALALAVGGCVNRPADEPEYAPLTHPFRGATLLVDEDSLAAHWQRANGAGWLTPIVDTPQVRWLTGPDDLADLGPVRQAARRQKALLVVALYHIPNRDCAGVAAGASDSGAYQEWVEDVVARLGDTPAAIILEPDAVAAECFDADRAEMLTRAVRTLADAGHHVYLDAGHPRWRPPAETAARLRTAGIEYAEGFSVNVANRQPTADSHRWAVELSRLVGDREAIIDTSRNGLPEPPADDDWCNPARQALGNPPTTDPGLDRVAALLWVKRPGESDGDCGTDPGTELFVPRQARTLIMNAPSLPEPARRSAATARPPA